MYEKFRRTIFPAVVNVPDANERGSSVIGKRTHFLRNARDCGQRCKEIEDITRWREDMNFIFEWQDIVLATRT